MRRWINTNKVEDIANQNAITEVEASKENSTSLAHADITAESKDSIFVLKLNLSEILRRLTKKQ